MENHATKVLIVGGHEQAVLLLKYIIDHDMAVVVGCVCREDDLGEDGIFPSLLKAAAAYDVEAIKTNDINSSDFFNEIKIYEADIVLSLQNNRIFSQQWVEHFSTRLGIVNVHYAPLPQYAGYWPELWAIWNQEKEFAVTAHYVGNGIDTGDIIAQRWFPLDDLETRKSLYNKSTKNCYLMMCELLPEILIGRVESASQNLSNRTFYKKSLPEQGFLDLNWEIEKIERFIRAISFPGYPGPKLRIGQTTYTLFEGDYAFFEADLNKWRKG